MKEKRKPLVYWLSLYWQDLPLRHKGLIFNALPLLVLLASLAMLFYNEQQTTAIETKLNQALVTQKDIQDIHTQLIEASASVRNYLLTEDKRFLKIHFLAKQRIPFLLNKLNQTLEDAQQKQSLQKIIPIVSKNLQDLSDLAQDDSKIATATLISKFNQQNQTLSILRNKIEAMNIREAELVDIEQTQLNLERQRNINTTIFAAFFGVIGTIIGAILFSKTIVKRVQLVRDSAAHLAKGEPLALPSISKDELGQLSQELDQASQLLAKSNREAHQAKYEAEEANKAKSQFLSRTSHELRTPLNAILGFAQLLEDDLDAGSKHKDNAKMISHAGKHLLKLINEVLDIARIESGDLSLNITHFNLSTLLDEASTYIKPLGKIKDMELVTSYSNMLMINADRQRLMQVVLNILSNAFKYGPESSTVYLSAFKTQDFIEITIEDQGPGIPTAKRQHLFTPFNRLGAENSNIEGTGLGLALSKHMMEAMQGRIELDSHKSIFRLYLPLNINLTETSTKDNPSNNFIKNPISQNDEPSKNTKPFVILYVEDHASNRALVEAMIKRQSNIHSNIKLHFAKNLKEAKSCLHDISPDLMMIDLHLPDGSGEDLVIHVKNQANFKNKPIFILSADAMPASIQRLDALGIDAYFTKPLDIALFNQTLLSHLSHTK